MLAKSTWAASLPLSSGTSFAGRLSMLGGTLTLADEAITFTPLAGLGRVRRFALADVDSAVAHADRPPRLRLVLRNGKAVVFMVLPGPATAAWSRDTSARDEAIAAINAALNGE